MLLRNHQRVKLIDGVDVEERIRMFRFVDIPRLRFTGGHLAEYAIWFSHVFSGERKGNRTDVGGSVSIMVQLLVHSY